jgi:predicted membrane-bound mannosyltransferase
MAFRELKAIDVMSMATVTAVIAAIWGFIAGIFAALGAGMLAALDSATGMGMFSAYMGVASIVIFPIMYAIAGFIGGAITAFVYNIVAQKVGGVKLDL